MPQVDPLDQAVDALVDWYDDYLAGRKPTEGRLRRTSSELRPAARTGVLEPDVLYLLDHSDHPLALSTLTALERVRFARNVSLPIWRAGSVVVKSDRRSGGRLDENGRQGTPRDKKRKTQ